MTARNVELASQRLELRLELAELLLLVLLKMHNMVALVFFLGQQIVAFLQLTLKNRNLVLEDGELSWRIKNVAFALLDFALILLLVLGHC